MSRMVRRWIVKVSLAVAALGGLIVARPQPAHIVLGDWIDVQSYSNAGLGKEVDR